MSDINPLTGGQTEPNAFKPMVRQAPVVLSAPKPQTAFDDGSTDINSAEAWARQELEDKASATKFATGNKEEDVMNYLQFKKNIQGLLGLLDG